MVEQLLFIGNEGLRAFQRLVHVAGQNVITHRPDMRPGAGRRLHQFAQQREIGLVVRAWITRGVHQLDREIDAFGRSVGLPRRHDVFLAQDRRIAVDQYPRALPAIGDDRITDDQALTWLEFDFEAHATPLLGGCSSAATGTAAARSGQLAPLATAPWWRAAAWSARRANWRPPRSNRRASGCRRLPAAY